jgi:hypothetical protein
MLGSNLVATASVSWQSMRSCSRAAGVGAQSMMWVVLTGP